jgi:hypothetical protein
MFGPAKTVIAVVFRAAGGKTRYTSDRASEVSMGACRLPRS